MNRKFRRAAIRFVLGTFIQSIQDKFASSKSGDDSRDFTDDTSAYARYKKRASRKKNGPNGVTHEVNESVELSTNDNTPELPRKTPS